MGGIVAGVVVVGLILAGIVAVTNRDEAPLPDDQLYAPLAGYSFETLPAGVVDIARSPFDNVPQLRGVLDDLSGRAIVRDGRTAAFVLVYQFNESIGSSAAATQEFLDDSTTLASQREDITIAGRKGAYFIVGSSHQGIAVPVGKVAVLVQSPLGADRSELESLTTAMLARVQP